jgi:hypothetical protein
MQCFIVVFVTTTTRRNPLSSSEPMAQLFPSPVLAKDMYLALRLVPLEGIRTTLLIYLPAIQQEKAQHTDPSSSRVSGQSQHIYQLLVANELASRVVSSETL